MILNKMVLDGGYCPEWLCVALRLNHLHHPELDSMPLWWPTTDDRINIYRWPGGDGYGKQVSVFDIRRPPREQNEQNSLASSVVGYHVVGDGYVPCVVQFDRFRPTFTSSQKSLSHREGQRFTVLNRFSCNIIGYRIHFEEDGEELDAWCGEVCMPDNQELYDKVLEQERVRK